MFGTALIVFREVLEASLIIGLMAAATRDLPGRARMLAGGILLGAAGSAAVAFGMEGIARVADGVGQELLNAAILGVAVLMLAWHNIWMASHGQAMSADARAVGGAIRDGRRDLSVLLIVIAVAVLREGAETVLFLHGIALSGSAGTGEMITGALLGLAGGGAVGLALYLGLMRIPLKWFFSATSLLVLLLAAGMAAQAARFLVQADLLPSLAAPLWDLSGALPNGSPAGVLLHGLVGYDAQPSGMQFVFYAAAFITIAAGMRWTRPGRARARSQTH